MEKKKKQVEGYLGEKQRKVNSFSVSHHISVVQFLLLSSAGNNYQVGGLPGQLAPISLLHAPKYQNDLAVTYL